MSDPPAEPKQEEPKAVVPFDFKGMPVRVVKDEKGEPWFVAKDVCGVLGLVWNSRSIQHVPEEWKGMRSVLTPIQNRYGSHGTQETTVAALSEAGLYFFLNRSDSPVALPFQKWVNGTVLPSIRKTGGYLAGEERMGEDELVLKAMQVLQGKVENLRREVEQKGVVIQLQITKLDVQKPKVQAYDQFLDGKTGRPIKQIWRAVQNRSVPDQKSGAHRRPAKGGGALRRGTGHDPNPWGTPPRHLEKTIQQCPAIQPIHSQSGLGRTAKHRQHSRYPCDYRVSSVIHPGST